VTLPPRLRTLALTAHIVSSVGWLGAVAAALVLAVAGTTSDDGQTVRGAYLGLELLARYALVPLALASLLTGLLQSLGTAWGLFRHYWVLAKLLINLFASVVLVLYLPTLDRLADTTDGNPSPALHAGAALLLLLVATVLAVYKPRGVTPYGWRKLRQRQDRPVGRA
jgi:hypothetical protein